MVIIQCVCVCVFGCCFVFFLEYQTLSQIFFFDPNELFEVGMVILAKHHRDGRCDWLRAPELHECCG